MAIPGFTMLIDDNDISQYSMALVSYQTKSCIERKVTGVDIPGAHGTQQVPSALSSNSFTANIICTGASVLKVHRQVRKFFAYMYSTQDSHKIVFTDDLNVSRYAILESPDEYKVINGMDGAFTEIKLTFYMPNPFTYENESDKIVKEVRNNTKIIIENDAFECPATYTIQNATTEDISGIVLKVNDEVANFSCTLKRGNKLVLDSVEYQVLFNNQTRLDYWSGEMPLLKNGDNEIFVTNEQNSPLLVTVEFTKKWV